MNLDKTLEEIDKSESINKRTDNNLSRGIKSNERYLSMRTSRGYAPVIVYIPHDTDVTKKTYTPILDDLE